MSGLKEMTDFQLREELIAIDGCEDVDVTQWEADFIDDVAFGGYTMSEKQRERAEDIIKKYEGRY